MERKLATLKNIDNIQPIEGADKIELATVGGWKVVVGKDEGYKIGDLVVYCEVDSFLPIKNEFEFLRKSSFKKMLDREGFRLKTIKLRGQISQGLILPLSVLEGEEEMKIGISEQPWGPQLQLGPYDDALVIEEGVEVTNYLDIIKYEPPIPAELAGVVKGGFPSFIPKTDEERIQNLTKEFDTWKGKTFYVTEKLDGSSTTFYFKDDVFGICGRNWEYEESDTNTYWRVAREYDLENKMKDFGLNISIQGELIGEGIQGNPYKLKGQTVRLFNLFDIDLQEYHNLPMFEGVCNRFKMEMVPVLEKNFTLPNSIEDLISFADAKSELNPNFDREGVVIRSLDRTISFKVISNKFLLNEK